MMKNKFIQTVDNVVNLIGGAAEGLPLPQDFLAACPDVRNLPAKNYDPPPDVHDVYDPKTDTFHKPSSTETPNGADTEAGTEAPADADSEPGTES